MSANVQLPDNKLSQKQRRSIFYENLMLKEIFVRVIFVLNSYYYIFFSYVKFIEFIHLQEDVYF